MNPRTWVAHGIYFNASEISAQGSAVVSVCHYPAADTCSALGVCPTKELEAAGGPWASGWMARPPTIDPT